MSANQIEMLVFQDGRGDYYVLPRQAWEQARVPQERREELRRLLGEGQKAQAVKAKKLVKLEDLSAKELTADRAKRVRGGAVNPVGSFTATSSLSSTLTGSDWQTKT